MKIDNSFPGAFNIIEKVLGTYGSPVEYSAPGTLSPFPTKYVEIDRNGHKIILIGSYDGAYQMVWSGICSTEYLTSAKGAKIQEMFRMINPSISPVSFDISKISGKILLFFGFYNCSNRTLEIDIENSFYLLLKRWDKYYPSIYKLI